MNPKISVIIPTYNAEDYLMEAVNSVINQSFGFENIELILVDDNSTDNTKTILKELSSKYDNVHSIFLKKNSGSASIPRNKGLSLANAEYIMFLDSDDIYYPEMCEKLYKNMNENNADLVSSRFKYKYESKIKIPKTIFDNEKRVISAKNIFEKPKIFNTGFTTMLWNKIYKKEIILNNNIKFPKHEQNEDIYFTIKYYLCSEKILILNNYYGYEYNIREIGSSISITFKKENLIKMTKGLISVLDLLEDYSNEFSSFKGGMLLGWTKWFLYTNLRTNRKTQQELIKKVQKYYKEYSLTTRIQTIPLIFNIIVNISYKIFAIWPKSLIIASNLKNKF